MMKASILAMMALIAGAAGQQSGKCGAGTYFESEDSECRCLDPLTMDADDPGVIQLAGIFDTETYSWGPDVFAVTVKLLNEGWWGVLTPETRLEYDLVNSACDETVAMRSYWALRSANGNKPMHGIIGARCSGASIALARIAGLESVPQLSPASSSSLLSNKEEFPSFSRMVAPNDERGEAGALTAMLRLFDWERVGIIATDTQYAKDFVNDFKSSWVGDHGDWVGQVAFSDTVQLTADGTVDADSVLRVLNHIPTDPDVTSRVIFLSAHPEHAFPILEAASNLLNPDTIFVGPSSWTVRDGLNDYAWLDSNASPGYLGLAPFRSQDQLYQDFMQELHAYQRAQGKPILEELPTFGGETVDAIRAMTKAIMLSGNRRDGKAVVRLLRRLEFDGVSGRVAFTADGDRKDQKYSLFNAQRDANGELVWKPMGTTGTDVGSAKLNVGVESVCFAEVGCGLAAPPDDMYPPPPYKLPGWAIFLIVGLTFVFIALVYVTGKYHRSSQSKRKIRAELDALRDSVVGMRASECQYIPKIAPGKGDVEQALDGSIAVAPIPTPKWMWQETKHMMGQHPSQTIYDTKNCWILYPPDCAKKIEAAYRKGTKEHSPLAGYTINFAKMEQTKAATGFKRRVQRAMAVEGGSSTTFDLQSVELGEDFPAELIKEPRMVLCEKDIIQISKQRKDGWAFGTKLHHTDEAAARQLLAVALLGSSSDDDAVTTDTGWFPLNKTRIPTADDLKPLQQTVGDGTALEAPIHWSKVSDPSVVQKKHLDPSNQERIAVERAFLSTLGSNARVLCIERVEHLSMWQSYAIKRQTICSRETSDDPKKALERFERKWLFHGTNKEVMDKILQQGFNRSFCGKNATVFGKGVYFARDAKYSASKTYAVPDRQGKQYMMACRVVVGEYCYGKTNALTPDVRDHSTQTLYDSTVDSTSDPSIYVTYHDAQAYPEYLITFKTN